jgi:hypothetical protein
MGAGSRKAIVPDVPFTDVHRIARSPFFLLKLNLGDLSFILNLGKLRIEQP